VFRCMTQEVECEVKEIFKRIDSSSLKVIEEDAGTLKDSEVGEVLIKTKEKVVVENFNKLQELGRFVLVRGYDTCAGGIILEE